MAVGVGIGCLYLLLHGGDGAHREGDQTLLQCRLTARDDDGRAILIGLAEDAVHRGRAERQEEDTVEQFGIGQQNAGAVQVRGANHSREMRGELHMIVEQALAAPLMVVLEPEIGSRRAWGLAWDTGGVRVNGGGDPFPLAKLHGRIEVRDLGGGGT